MRSITSPTTEVNSSRCVMVKSSSSEFHNFIQSPVSPSQIIESQTGRKANTQILLGRWRAQRVMGNKPDSDDFVRMDRKGKATVTGPLQLLTISLHRIGLPSLLDLKKRRLH